MTCTLSVQFVDIWLSNNDGVRSSVRSRRHVQSNLLFTRQSPAEICQSPPPPPTLLVSLEKREMSVLSATTTTSTQLEGYLVKKNRKLQQSPASKNIWQNCLLFNWMNVFRDLQERRNQSPSSIFWKNLFPSGADWKVFIWCEIIWFEGYKRESVKTYFFF